MDNRDKLMFNRGYIPQSEQAKAKQLLQNINDSVLVLTNILKTSEETEVVIENFLKQCLNIEQSLPLR